MNTELNERIAVEVTGYSYGSLPGVCVNKWWRKLANGYLDVRYEGAPDYSGDIAAAWLVVEELIKRGVQFLVYHSDDWSCRLWLPGSDCSYGFHQPTAPLAICHAALDISAKLRHGGPRE